MAHLIDKDALVAEIERRITTYKNISGEDRRTDALISLKNFLDTHEVKEVDLEKELIEWHKEHFKKDGTFIGMSGFYLTNSSQMDIAKHFFELGVSCQVNNINMDEVKTAAKAWSEDDENTRGCDYIGAVVAERAFVACAEWLINKAQKGE